MTQWHGSRAVIGGLVELRFLNEAVQKHAAGGGSEIRIDCSKQAMRAVAALDAQETRLLELMQEFSNAVRIGATELGISVCRPSLQKWKVGSKRNDGAKLMWRLLMDAEKPRVHWNSEDMQLALAQMPTEHVKICEAWNSIMVILNASIRHVRATQSIAAKMNSELFLPTNLAKEKHHENNHNSNWQLG